jgi:hypothetical protein
VNDGQSVQLAVIRSEKETVLHVNTQNGSVPETVQLLNSYFNKPWINPDKGETFALNCKHFRCYGIHIVLYN